MGSREWEANLARRIVEHCAVARMEVRMVHGSKNARNDSNFLYPAVLLLASKEVSPRSVESFVGSAARRTRLQGGSEEKQCQRL
jgi:hypothetical protein